MKKIVSVVLAGAVLATSAVTVYAAETKNSTVSYYVDPGYMVEIPSVTLGDSPVNADIAASNVVLETGEKIVVELASATNTPSGSAFSAKTDDGSSTANYTISKDGAAVSIGDTVAEFASDGTQALTFSAASGTTHAGMHTEVLTFKISVEDGEITPCDAFKDGAVVSFDILTRNVTNTLVMNNENGAFTYVSGGSLVQSGTTTTRDGNNLVINVDFAGTPDIPSQCYVITINADDNSYSIVYGTYAEQFTGKAVSITSMKIDGKEIAVPLTKK